MPERPVQSGGRPDPSSPWVVALGAGTELVVCVLLGSLAGQWLDRRLGTAPWLLLLGALSGISVGLYQLIRTSAKRRDGGPGRG